MTAPSFAWSRHLIANSGAEPEQQIAASLIVAARESCASGNRDDCQWLTSCGVAYLSLICPAHVDEREVLERLLAGLPILDDPDEGRRENAEDFIQVCIDLAAGFARNPLMDSEWGERLYRRPATTSRPREPTPAARQPLLSGLED